MPEPTGGEVCRELSYERAIVVDYIAARLDVDREAAFAYFQQRFDGDVDLEVSE